MTSKVWICKEQMMRGDLGPVAMDYSPALAFGDVEFITHHDMPLYGKSSVQDRWEADVVRFCQAYDDTRDFVVTTGQPIAIFSIGWALGRAGKVPRFLVWRPQESQYRALNFDGAFGYTPPPPGTYQ